MGTTVERSLEMTLETIKLLEELVNIFGDTKNTARILGINHSTFVKYLNGNEKIISPRTWQNKIEPYIQKNKTDLFKDLTKELIRLRKLERKTFDMEYKVKILENRIKFLENEMQDKLYKISRSPFNVYFLEFVNHNAFYSFPVLEDLNKIRNDIDISLLSFYKHTNEFQRLYELFRPRSIRHEHPYWGTAKIIDQIFQTISGVFGEEFDYNFSKFGQTYLDSLYRKRAIDYEVDWKKLQENAIYISESINQAIMLHAVDNKEYFKNNYTHYYYKFIQAYMKTFYQDWDFPIINEADIKPGVIVIGDKLIEFNNSDQLDNKIYAYFGAK